MSHYDYTKSRVLQWIGIILILGFFVGTYWYFQARAAVNLKTVNETGLVGYWNFDEGTGTSAYDKSGQNNTGTLTNGPTWVDGKSSKAVNFDGANDYAVTSSSAVLDVSSKSFAVSAWFKTSTTQTDKIIVEHSVWTSDNGVYQLGVSGPSSLRFSWPSYYTQYGATPDITGVTYSDNKWHHVVGVFDNANKIAKTYYDGVLKTTQGGITAGPISGTSPLYIGDRGAGSGYFFTGAIDEVRVYNRALSGTEITNLYTLGTATVNASQNTSLTNGLVGQWSFNGDDLSGTTAYDRSGSGNNGTLVNGPAITEGKIGQALSFDGVNDYVNVGSGIIPVNANFTISAWTKASSNSAIFSQGHDGTNDWGLNFLTDVANIIVAGALYQVTFALPAVGQYHHYVLTRSGNTWTVYIDGVSAGTLTQAGSLRSTGVNYIGARKASAISTDTYANGAIDETRIYNRALSATEIQSLYTQGGGTKVNSSVSQPQGTGRLDSGLAGYWKLDENSGSTAADSSTNGNTGTLTNGPTWSTGQIGSAVTFDGSNDYVNIGSSATINTSVFTYSAWIYNTGANTDGVAQGVIGTPGGSSGGPEWRLGGAAPSTMSLLKQGVAGIGTSNSNVPINTWSHIAVSYDASGNYVFYLNGRPDGSGTNLQTFTFTSLQIGRGFDDSASVKEFFKGNLDDVRIYNRTLSADEVSQLYRLTSPTGVDTSLKGYWSFNGKDMSGTTAYDRSGSGNNGTLTNSPTITEGKLGQALSFDGANQYISVGNVYNGVKSISFWIKPDNTTKKIIDLSGSANIEVIGQTITVNGLTSPTIYVDGVASSMIDTNWHFVTITTGTGLNASAVDIGRVSSGYFDGRLDEVRMYSEVLTASQIASLYNLGGPVAAAAGFVCGTSTITDVDSNTYNTVLIGSQCWTKENMMTTKYPDGTSITRGPTGATWVIGDNAYYAYPPNAGNTAEESLANIQTNKLGFVYQWSAVMKGSVTPGVQGICPTNWHVPTHDEYTTLERAVCTSGTCVTDFPIDTTTTGWRGTNEGSKLSLYTSGGTNSSGFSGILAGNRNTDGSFYGRSTYAYLWSSTPSGGSAWDRALRSSSSTVGRIKDNKAYGFSVRCLKN